MWGAAEGFIRDECSLCDRSVEVRNSVQKLQISVPSCPRYSRGGSHAARLLAHRTSLPRYPLISRWVRAPHKSGLSSFAGIGHAIVAVRSGSTPISFVSVPRSSTVQSLRG